MLSRICRSIVCRAAALVALAALAGCSSDKPTTGETGATSGGASGQATPPAAQTSGPTTYAASDLKVGLKDYLPPLDEGRIEVAAPQDWEIGSRQQGYVAWFPRYKDTRTLPQIRITVEDTPAEAAKDVTKDNVEAFAEWLAGHVKRDLKKDDELVEAVKPLVLGENAFGRYVRKGRYRESPAEQHILVTSRNGRMYTINQLVLKGDLSKPDVRDAAYAVGAGLKFSAGGALTPEPSFTPPGETPAETPPQ